MTIRQDETSVHFIDIAPESLEDAATASQNELEANIRAWEKTIRTIKYVEATYPDDKKLIEALQTIRHHIERRI